MITGIAWQQVPTVATRFAIAAVLAATLGLAANSRPAEAGSRWVGPAIAGAIIGGVLAHEYYHHHRHYRPYYYGRPVKYRRKHHGYYGRPVYYGPRAYYPPAVVVPLPIPVPFFVVPGY